MSRIKTCVSLYSLQDEYLNKRMSFADIMRYVKSLGTEGIEILPDQILKGSSHITDELLGEWNALVAETGLKPVIADVFLNTNLYKNRKLTRRECIDLLIDEIIQANRLGIHLIRLVSMVPYWVIEPLLPYCEKYDVAIAIEIHAGMAFDVAETNAFIEEVKRLNSPYAGLVVDTGIFCRKLPRVVRNYEISIGTSEGIFDYVDSLFAQGTDLHQVLRKSGGQYPEDLKKEMKCEHDQISVPLLDGYENYPFEVLDDLIPYIKHFHLKMFEMTEEGYEYSMDYKALLTYLHDKGYDGYVATEYEGNRFTLAGQPMKEKQQVAANQKYIQECLKEIQG